MRNFFDNPVLLLVLVLLIVVIFGAKRLPDAARSLGRSMRIFKAEVKEMKDDGKPGASGTSGTPGAAPGTPARPLEGRVLGDDVPPVAPPVDRTTSASGTDSPRSGA